jgi:Spy/CpxP family protein refolding chaperone
VNLKKTMVGASLALMLAAPGAFAQDNYDLLPEGEGRDEVFALCSGCHSVRLVVQQGLTEKAWDKMLDWMVEEQGMAEMDEETRRVVLDYLSEHLNTDHRPPWMEQ